MRPFIHLNCAVSLDGKLSGPDGKQTRISSEPDMVRVHRLRAKYDAILVGINTVLSDDPKLSVDDKRAGKTGAPLRIVLDSNGITPVNAKVLDGSQPTLIVTADGCSTEFQNAKVMRLGTPRVELPKLFDALDKMGVKSILVEGGGEILHSFLQSGEFDIFTMFVAKFELGEGGATIGKGPKSSMFDGKSYDLTLGAMEMREGGELFTYTPNKSKGKK